MKKMKLASFFLVLSLPFMFNTTSQASEYLSDKTETIYDNSNGLVTGKANSICQSNDGYIYIAQYRGLVRYNSKNFELITPNDSSIKLEGIKSVDSYKDMIFVGTQQNLYIYQKNKFRELKISDNISVSKLKVYDDICYISTSNGLYKYDILKDEISYVTNKVTFFCYYNGDLYTISNKKLFKNGQIFEPFSSKIVTSVYADSKGLLVGDEKGVYLNNTNNYLSIGSDLNINSYLSNGDIYYLGCDQGLYFINTKTNEINCANDLTVSTSVEKIIFDFEGNLWLASSRKGVSKVTKNKVIDFFKLYRIDENTCNAFIKYKNKYYVGTESGIEIVDTNDEISNFRDYSLDNIDSRIRAFATYNDYLYIATYKSNDYDLIKYDGLGNYENIDLSLYTSHETNASDIRYIQSDSNYLFIATNNEIIRYDGTNYTTLPLDIQPLYFYLDSSTIYLVLQDTGIATLDINFNSESKYKLIEDTIYPSLKVLKVNDTLIYNKNNDLYIYKDNVSKKFDYNFEGSIVEILHINNKYYIATDIKIYEFDDILQTNTPSSVVGLTDGLVGCITANGSGEYDPLTNSFYFVTSLGVYQYKLDRTETNGIPPKLVVSHIYANGEDLGDIDNTTISNRTARLTFQIDAISYKINPEYKIYYKLDGEDTEYRLLADGINEVSYTNLSGKKYQFHIYVENEFGKSDVITISFEKAKRFYEVAGFWIIIVAWFIFILIITNVFYLKHKVKKTIERQNEYRTITLESIEAIARTIDAKDHYTNGHSLRVGYYSREIAKEMNFSPDEIENIYYAGLLHDIGKIAVPDIILNKPGKLTDQEFEVIKSHTVEGSKILSSISTIPNITLGARYHHESYDGSGYPEHLVGENIPLIARIICAADCYDAMATQRVYKEPFLTDHIIEEFTKCAGTQFDPEISKIVIKLIKEGKIRPNIDTNFEKFDNKNLKNNKK